MINHFRIIFMIIIFTGLTRITIAQTPKLEEGIWAVAWSPDGQMLATANPGGKVYIYDSEGQLIHTLSGHDRRAGGLAWSPDSKWLATGGMDNYVRIWDIENGNLIREINAHASILILDWQPNGNYLVAASSDTLQAWNTETWHEFVFESGITILDLEWNPTGTRFAFVFYGGMATATINDDDFTDVHVFSETIHANSVSWSRDGTRLVTAGGQEGRVRLWDVESEQQISVLLESDEAIWDAIFLDELGEQVLAVTEGGNIHRIDVSSQSVVSTQMEDAWLWAAAWNPLRDRLVLGGLIELSDEARDASAINDFQATGFLKIISIVSEE